MSNIQKILTENFDKKKLIFDESMKNHTSFRIGGKAKAVFLPFEEKDIINIIGFCKSKNINYYIIGNGSNILVKDSGFDGVIIKIGDNFSKISSEQNFILAQAGASLKNISEYALFKELSGFEFAHGIPGSFGGAVCMNAGAYDGEMKDVVLFCNIIKDDKIIQVSNEELDFGYRTSIIQKENSVMLSAKIKLSKGNKDDIKKIMDDLKYKRNQKQPLEFYSAGSVFKRPDGYFAGKLIMDSGLAGKKIGGAEISQKHCGFIINKGSATAEDVILLINYIKDEVYNRFDVKLEEEVKIIGD